MGEKQTDPIPSEPIEALLGRVPFFQSLERIDLARLAGALEEVRLPAGTQILATARNGWLSWKPHRSGVARLIANPPSSRLR